MSYQVSFSDSANKGFIVVEDDTLNTETSITLPGRQVRGYGEFVAQNFLHLLENFANNNPPARPVEGQLWYDTSESSSQLKIYDGINWVASGGLKKAATEPLVSSSISGDLWVNTDTQQLYLFTGSTWILVGPEFSQGNETGIKIEIITGTDNVSHDVLTIRDQSQLLYIVSNSEFTPRTTLTGFPKISKGINQSTALPLKYYGVAEKAEALIIAGQKINAENFLRSDATSTTNFGLNVNNNNGITVGNNKQGVIKIENDDLVIQNSIGGAKTIIRMRQGGVERNVVTIDSLGKVGVNTIVPQESVDIVGNVRISPTSQLDQNTSGILVLTNTKNSTNIGDGVLVVSGGVGIGLDLNVGGDITIGGDLVIQDILPIGNSSNIGSNANKINNIHAVKVFSDVEGNLTGNITGNANTANRLVSPSTFSINGDVEPRSFQFDGQGPAKNFDIRISAEFIADKELALNADSTDEILLNKKTGDVGIKRITKHDFLKTIPLTPVGALMPFAGQVAPQGWVFCDGRTLLISQFPRLFDVIGTTYGSPDSTSFNVPDTRGRTPLGLDNMGGTPANRVTSPNASVLGGTDGTESIDIRKSNLPQHSHALRGDSGGQYYAASFLPSSPDGNSEQLSYSSGTNTTFGIRTTSGIIDGGQTGNNDYREVTDGLGNVIDRLGTPINIMNPHISFNYIIYTGQ
jgi:microcystin-dependent protein